MSHQKRMEQIYSRRGRTRSVPDFKIVFEEYKTKSRSGVVYTHYKQKLIPYTNGK